MNSCRTSARAGLPLATSSPYLRSIVMKRRSIFDTERYGASNLHCLQSVENSCRESDATAPPSVDPAADTAVRRLG